MRKGTACPALLALLAVLAAWFGPNAALAQAAPPAPGDLVAVSDCENLRDWRIDNLKASVRFDGRRRGNKVLRLSYSGHTRGRLVARVPAGVLTAHHAFSFSMRGSRANASATMWVDLVCENGAFYRKELSLGDFEWSQVVFVPEDYRGWDRARGKKGQEVDWTKIRSVRLRIMCDSPTERGNILLDAVAFRKIVPPPAPTEAVPSERISINDCDSADSWKAAGRLTVAAQERGKQQGAACLALSHAGSGGGSATTAVPKTALSASHVLSFRLRGTSPAAKVTLSIELEFADSAPFRKRLDITNPRWSEVLLIPKDFQPTVSAFAGRSATFGWPAVRSMTFRVQSDGEERATILLDDVCFRKLHVVGPRDLARDRKNYWWWDGQWDPYLARHASEADWAHRQSQPQHKAPLKFDRFILSPYMSYTAYLHNDKAYERGILTVTDWRLKPIKIVNLGPSSKGVVAIKLSAPARCGTYLFNLERYAKGSDRPERYQTGVMVLAKRLTEPRGIWGFHAYMMHSGQHNRFDVILDMFQAAGMMCVRESIPMPRDRPQSDPEGNIENRRRYYKAAAKRGITMLAIFNVPGHPQVYRRITSNRFVPPRHMKAFIKDIETVTRTFKGQVEWYELGNEMNERKLEPYAELLKKTYAAAKRGDPNCKVIMCGCHTNDQWQKRLYQMEKAEKDPRYKTYQDAVATHPYPALQGVEPTLRHWLYNQIGVETLRAKGNMMTEAGWPPLPRKIQSLLRSGLMPRDYNGELDTQCWLGMYCSVMLGEHLKMGSTLHGVYFFRALTTLKHQYIWDKNGKYISGELAMPSEGFFVSAPSGWAVTVARPFVYTHNTVARLLTHEVKHVSVPVRWNRRKGSVESYAFRRPGETVVATWIGPPLKSGIRRWQQQHRAPRMDITVKAPAGAAMALAVDLEGHERVVPIRDGLVKLQLTRPPDIHDGAGQLLWSRGGQPTFLRFLDGRRVGAVFFQNIEQMPGGRVRIVKGTPETSTELAEGISADRDLPAVGPTVPAPGRPMVLYSRAGKTLYIVGRSQADVAAGEKALATIRK